MNAHSYAVLAGANSIRISAVYVPTPERQPAAIPIMQDYALTTSGSFRVTAADGNGTGGAINSIIADCGQGSLQLSATPPRVECINETIVPNQVNLTINIFNNGSGTCEGLMLSLDNGAGPGGSGTVNTPVSVSLGSLVAGASTSYSFSAILNTHPWGGLICFQAHITSTTCPSNFLDICVDVPQCGSCIPSESITLIPDNPNFPAEQHAKACARLVFGYQTEVIVPVREAANVPTISITPGCVECEDTPSDCTPLSAWEIGNWVYNPTNSTYTTTVTATANATGCCACIHLDYVLPVELASFTPIPGDNSVTLNWSTASETNNDHFEVSRNGTVVAQVNSQGNSSQSHSYTWVDDRASNGTTYTYALVAVSMNGERQILGSVEAIPSMNNTTVSEFALHQNFPNPFNPATEIVFDMKTSGLVSIRVYNMVGQEVATLVNNEVQAGRHSINFNASSLSSGLYIYKMETQGFSAMNKMLLIK